METNIDNTPVLSRSIFRPEHLMAILGIARCQLQYAHKTGLLSATDTNAQGQRSYDWTTVVGYKTILLLAEKLNGLPSVRHFVGGIFNAIREHPELLGETESTIIASDGKRTVAIVSNPGAEQRPLPTWPLITLAIADFHGQARERLKTCSSLPTTDPKESAKKHREPVTITNVLTQRFHTQDVVVLTGATSIQLRNWDNDEMIRPIEHNAGQFRYYDFAGVVEVEVAVRHRKLGISLNEIHDVIVELRTLRASIAYPLTEAYLCIGLGTVRIWHDQSADILHQDEEPCLHFSVRLWLKRALIRLERSKKKFSPHKEGAQ